MLRIKVFPLHYRSLTLTHAPPNVHLSRVHVPLDSFIFPLTGVHQYETVEKTGIRVSLTNATANLCIKLDHILCSWQSLEVTARASQPASAIVQNSTAASPA